MKTQLHNCYICAEGLGQSHTSSLPGWHFSLSESLWVKVSRFCRFSCSVLDPTGSLNPSFHSSRLSELCLMFGCGSLHLFPSAAGWSLSVGNHTRLLFKTLAKYH